MKKPNPTPYVIAILLTVFTCFVLYLYLVLPVLHHTFSLSK